MSVWPSAAVGELRERLLQQKARLQALRDQAPFSDGDLLFLHTPRCGERLTGCIGQAVRDCWDAGIKLGHSVRTPADALAAARLDPQFATSLVEARLLWGDERLFEGFKAK